MPGSSARNEICICKGELPTAVVKIHFLKLALEHIEHIMGCVSRNTARIACAEMIQHEFETMFS